MASTNASGGVNPYMFQRFEDSSGRSTVHERGRGPRRTRRVNAVPKSTPLNKIGSIMAARYPATNTLSAAASGRTSALPDYAGQFEQSMAASRANIESQFQSALSDIGKREMLAQGAVNLLPGQVQGIFDRSNASAKEATAQLDKAQAAGGLRSFMSADAQMAPITAASAQDAAARQADVPLLRLGTTAAFDQQRGALNQAKMSAFGDLDSEKRSYLTNLAQQVASAQIQQQYEKDNFMRDLQGKDWLAEQDFNRGQAASAADFARQNRANAIQQAQATAEERRALNTFGSANTSAARGKFIQQYSPAVYKRITESQAFKSAMKTVGQDKGRAGGISGLFGGRSKYSVDDVAKQLENQGLYRTAAVLRQRYSTRRK